MKTCNKCKIEKDISCFTLKKSTKDGLQGACKECRNLSAKEYYKKNFIKANLKKKEYNKRNSETIKNKKQIYNEKNKEKIKIAKSEYYRKNATEIVEKSKLYRRVKRIKDPIFKLRETLRSRIKNAFNATSWRKNGPSEKLLGESFEFVHNYIEIQFKKGMNWSNRGEWHIDHKIPLASAKTKEELITLLHYTNLQPLWAKDNMTKKDKIIEHQIKLL